MAEAAKSGEQLIATNHSVSISDEKLPKQFLSKCESLANKMYGLRNIQHVDRDRRQRAETTPRRRHTGVEV